MAAILVSGSHIVINCTISKSNLDDLPFSGNHIRKCLPVPKIEGVSEALGTNVTKNAGAAEAEGKHGMVINATLGDSNVSVI